MKKLFWKYLTPVIVINLITVVTLATQSNFDENIGQKISGGVILLSLLTIRQYLRSRSRWFSCSSYDLVAEQVLFLRRMLLEMASWLIGIQAIASSILLFFFSDNNAAIVLYAFTQAAIFCVAPHIFFTWGLNTARTLWRRSNSPYSINFVGKKTHYVNDCMKKNEASRIFIIVDDEENPSKHLLLVTELKSCKNFTIGERENVFTIHGVPVDAKNSNDTLHLGTIAV